MRVTFTEEDLDAAAMAVAKNAVSGLPPRLADFLTRAQTEELQEEIQEATKTSLLFSLMNHIEPDDD